MASQSITVFIKDEEHVLSAEDIVAVAKRETPRRVNAYYVEIDGRQFPPKQLLRAATRTSKPFDTGVAVRALQALGFKVVKMAG
jgi:hypothetical protein